MYIIIKYRDLFFPIFTFEIGQILRKRVARWDDNVVVLVTGSLWVLLANNRLREEILDRPGTKVQSTRYFFKIPSICIICRDNGTLQSQPSSKNKVYSILSVS